MTDRIRPRVGVAVLTMGDRMPELLALLESVAGQDEPPARVVVVGNGAVLPELPYGVTQLELEENLGVSGGRNAAWRRLRDFGDVDVLVYLGVWMALTLLRTRSLSGLRAWFGGFAEGIRTSGGSRHPMGWRTVWRMSRLGRPPVI
ncbi:hypothetical protein OG875_10600 [Streptomyces sp. NBC_01498]|uniref:glycosyltransferase family 2 protein n=1 Tax=Streptomyces sp. NBC_01498 TaxID=2975870 RepID=UPI002E7BCBEA|nr:hypothetical protein [Streptomyces sp. NBC_01498]WTL25007.1 hypothetical protein OG875_10600 [Streptomyces sp. NBC_01498]